MASVDSYNVYALNVSSTHNHSIYSTDGSAALSNHTSIGNLNNSTGSSTQILGDTPYDSFSVIGYTSGDTQGGNSDVLTDAGGTVALVYRGYVTATIGGVTYHAAIGEDLDSENYFLFASTGSPIGSGTQPLTFTAVVVGTTSTEWVIKTETPYCFVSGTMLSTPSGEQAIETLHAGDVVITASGVAKPIRWIGQTVVATKFADKLRMMPVRIKAGALADLVPSRDLLVSPGHAIMVEGLLIHAGALVNGSSIVREERMPMLFTYFHVEVDSHDLLIAENTPAESFLEAVSDMRLDNFPERADLAGKGATTEMDSPRVKSALQLPASIRSVLEARATSSDERLAA